MVLDNTFGWCIVEQEAYCTKRFIDIVEINVYANPLCPTDQILTGIVCVVIGNFKEYEINVAVGFFCFVLPNYCINVPGKVYP